MPFCSKCHNIGSIRILVAKNCISYLSHAKRIGTDPLNSRHLYTLLIMFRGMRGEEVVFKEQHVDKRHFDE
jgi:hypothetical protein